MAMGRRKGEEQGGCGMAASEVPQAGGHPFYQRVNKISACACGTHADRLAAGGFDRFVEERCPGFYADQRGRPSLPPAVYLGRLLIGYFEGMDRERGIAGRVSDSQRCPV